MPEEEGFSEVGAVVSLEGLQETLTGMERYSAGIQGMANATAQQAGQISAKWDGVARDTQQALDATVTAVEEGMQRVQDAVFDPRMGETGRWRDVITGQLVPAEKIAESVERLTNVQQAAAEIGNVMGGVAVETESMAAQVAAAVGEVEANFVDAELAATAWAEANYAAAAPISDHIAYMQMYGNVTEEMTEDAAALEDALESQGLIFSKIVVWLQETGSYTDKWGRNWGKTIEEAKDVAKKFGVELAIVGDESEEMADKTDEAGEKVEKLGKKSRLARGMLAQLLRSLGQHRAASVAAAAGWSSLSMALGVAVAVGAAAVGAVFAMYGALERTEPLWDARDAFAALSDQVSLTSSTIVRDTQRASSFTVSEYKIITSANKDLLAGNEALAESYSDLMRLAYAVSRTTGKSVEQTFDAIASAIRSGSQAALEAADVWIDVETAQWAYAESLGLTIDQLSEGERQIIALEVVLEELPGYLDRTGVAADSALMPIRELTTEIGLLKEEMLATMGTKFVGWLAGITGFLWGKDPAALVRETRENIEAQRELRRLNEEIWQRREEFAPEEWRKFVGGPSPERVTVAQLGWEEYIRQQKELLGYPAPEAAPDPYAGISAHERRVLTGKELDARLNAIRLADEREVRLAESKVDALRELHQKAKAYTIGLAPYLADEELDRIYQRYIEIGERIIDQAGDIYGRPAQQEMKRFTNDMGDLAAELRKVDKAAGGAADSIADMGPFGEWAVAFAVEHGGKTPYEQYARHEEPLVAAVMDKMEHERVMRETGRPMTREQEEAFWYKVHGPFEVFPGGPIVGQKGPEYEAAKAELAGIPIEDIGKAYHAEWMARKGVVTSLEEMKTQENILAAFLADTAIPAQEDVATAVDTTTEKMGDLGKETDALAERFRLFFPDPTRDDEDGEEGEGEETLPPHPGEAAFEAGRLKRRPPPTITLPDYDEYYNYEFGGITTHKQTAVLHEDEGIIPFGSPGIAAAILSQMLGRVGVNVGPPGGMGGGGVNIGAINVPITVSGAVTRQTAAMLQTTIIEGIRHRAGAAMRREAHRLGF